MSRVRRGLGSASEWKHKQSDKEKGESGHELESHGRLFGM